MRWHTLYFGAQSIYVPFIIFSSSNAEIAVFRSVRGRNNVCVAPSFSEYSTVIQCVFGRYHTAYSRIYFRLNGAGPIYRTRYIDILCCCSRIKENKINKLFRVEIVPELYIPLYITRWVLYVDIYFKFARVYTVARRRPMAFMCI